MMHSRRVIVFALVSMLGYGGLAQADTLRCQTINGNTNCSGSNGVSCQTINGHKTCVSGHGDVVQSVGNGHAAETMDDEDLKDVATVQRWLQQHGIDPSHATNPAASDNN